MQSRKNVDDDLKLGVVLLGTRDTTIKEHFIRNAVRLTTWVKTYKSVSVTRYKTTFVEKLHEHKRQFRHSPRFSRLAKKRVGDGQDWQ